MGAGAAWTKSVTPQPGDPSRPGEVALLSQQNTCLLGGEVRWGMAQESPRWILAVADGGNGAGDQPRQWVVGTMHHPVSTLYFNVFGLTEVRRTVHDISPISS